MSDVRIRRLLPVLALASVLIPLVAQEKPATQPTRVRFEGRVLVQASNKETANERTREYLPEGDNLARWTRLAAWREFPKITDEPMAAARGLERTIRDRDAGARSSIIRNPKNGEVIVDYLLTSAEGGFSEFQVCRYARRAGGGLVCQQYGLRAYGDAQDEFLRELRERRPRLVEAMGRQGLEVVP